MDVFIHRAQTPIPHEDFVEASQQKVIRSTKDIVVQVQCCKQSSKESSLELCATFAGFFYIEEGPYILTSAYEIYKHAAAGATEYKAVFTSGSTADLHLIRLPSLDNVWMVDIAVFECNMKPLVPPRIRRGVAEAGKLKKALIVGPPRADDNAPFVAEGDITSVTMTDFAINACVGEEMSGSPVLVVGKLAGMVKGGQDPISGVVRAVPIGIILTFLGMRKLPLVRI